METDMFKILITHYNDNGNIITHYNEICIKFQTLMSLTTIQMKTDGSFTKYAKNMASKKSVFKPVSEGFGGSTPPPQKFLCVTLCRSEITISVQNNR